MTLLRTSALAMVSVLAGCHPTGSNEAEGTREQASLDCPTERTLISAPARDAILAQLAWFQASYSLDGQWEPSDVLGTSETSFSGVLEATHDGGDARWLSRCGKGIEIPVRVRLQAGDVLVADGLPGIVHIKDESFEPLSGRLRANVVAPRSVELVAEVDLAPWVADGLLATPTDLSVSRGVLGVELMPLGTRGRLTTVPERRTAGAPAPRLPPGATLVAVPPLPPVTILDWPGLDRCEMLGHPLSAPPLEALSALQASLDAASATYSASYKDGPGVSVSLEFESPTIACTQGEGGGASMLTDVRVKTSDDRVDVRLRGFIGVLDERLGFNTPSGVYQPARSASLRGASWALIPSVFEQRFGTMGLDLSAFAHVGVEAWWRGNMGTGSLRVLGFESASCSECDADGCVTCPMDQATSLLELSFRE